MLGHSNPEYVVEELALGVIDGGARIEQVVVRPAITIIGVIAYVDVLCCATYRVGKEQAAPLSVRCEFASYTLGLSFYPTRDEASGDTKRVTVCSIECKGG